MGYATRRQFRQQPAHDALRWATLLRVLGHVWVSGRCVLFVGSECVCGEGGGHAENGRSWRTTRMATE